MAIRLLLTAGDGWREAVEPWLARTEAWRDPRPAVVLTPQRAQGFYLRGRLVEQGRSLLGVRFWTPSDARKFLAQALQITPRPATLAEQALLARACAERLRRNGQDPHEASLRSAAQDPMPFLRAYDLLLGAGWSPAREGAPHARELARDFAAALDRAGLLTQAGLHGRLRETAPAAPAPLAQVLLLGFNAAHWPLWDLLQAVCRQAEDAEVALEQRNEFGERLDDLWVGSWEAFTGAAYEFPEADPAPDGPFATLATGFEAGTTAERQTGDVHFVATDDDAGQIRAVVLQALDYLRRPECLRLGIVFPEPDALALGVAEQLGALDVPLDDGIGSIHPGPFETRPWQDWLALQEEPTVRRLIAWVRACEAGGCRSGLDAVSAARAAQILDRALGVALVDRLPFLACQLESEKGEERALAAFLRRLILLPEEGRLGALLATTRKNLRRLDWKALLDRLPEAAPAGLEDLPVTRAAYLAWLREVTDSRERRRAGNHFYGRVHLLVYGQLAGQRWTHLILTGLNEGVWPRMGEGESFGSRHELAELNTRVRQLNRLGAGRGPQGEGHEATLPGHGHALLPIERQDLARRDLCRALRATSHAVCLAARTREQARPFLPSDFFIHAWQTVTGHPLGDKAFAKLAEKTGQHVRDHAALFPPLPPADQDIAATRVAYAARQSAATPFGRFQFAFEPPPDEPVQLTCKEWERALRSPAEVWLEAVVGVAPWPEGGLSWKMSQGTWTHRWLSLALATGVTAENLEARVKEAALGERRQVERWAHDAGVALNPWWHQLWAQALATARTLAGRLAPELAGRTAVPEFTLPRPLEIALPGAARADFSVRGRLDLLLVENIRTEGSAPPSDLAGMPAWVIDFKTGADGKISPAQLRKYHGVQVALYALGLRHLGARPVAMSVLAPAMELDPQMQDDALLQVEEPFRRIELMHRRGLFGESPDDRTHGRAPACPLTTRGVPAEVLEAKWALEPLQGEQA